MDWIAFCPYCIWICFFCLSSCNASAKGTICELIKYFIQKQGSLHSITSNQGIHFIANEIRQSVPAHGIHWSYHMTHNSEATDVVEWCNQFLEVHLWHQVGGNTLWGWSKVLQIANNVLNQYPLYCCFSHSRIHKSRNQGGRK